MKFSKNDGGLKYLVLAISLAAPGYINAGHGFFNSFEGVPWLPKPGLMPDQFVYFIDEAIEKFQTSSHVDSLDSKKKHLAFAEEKLAEGVTLLKNNNTSHHARIEKNYAHYLKNLNQSFSINQSADETNYQQYCADRLLQHMYILSIEVLDSDRSTAKHFLSLNEIASEYYLGLIENLSRDFFDSHFFKKEEVKWSWEIALEAD
ncbi:MAG: DUF5667 domain-containing protein [Gammaproteobacteria bacterium]